MTGVANRSRLWRLVGVVLGLLAAFFLQPLGIAIGVALLLVGSRSPRSGWLIAAALVIVVLSVALLLFGMPGAPTGGLIDPY